MDREIDLVRPPRFRGRYTSPTTPRENTTAYDFYRFDGHEMIEREQSLRGTPPQLGNPFGVIARTTTLRTSYRA